MSLLIIREIGKTKDFSGNDTLVNGILECLNSKNESIKNSGSLALGGICLVKYILFTFIKSINKGESTGIFTKSYEFN